MGSKACWNWTSGGVCDNMKTKCGWLYIEINMMKQDVADTIVEVTSWKQDFCNISIELT